MASRQIIRTLMLSLFAVVAVLAMSAVGATAASAACYKVAVAGSGTFEKSTCETPVGTTKEYIKATVVGPVVGEPGVSCAKVETAGTGTYSNSKCTLTTGAKEYIKVLAKPVWTVNGSVLPTNSTKSLKILKIAAAGAILKVPKAEEEIVCKKLAINAENTIGNVEVETGLVAGRDLVTNTFTECSNAKKSACTVKVPIEFTTPTFLNESTAGNKVYDEFRPKGAKELTPAEVTAKGEPASKEHEEELAPFVKIEQSGTGCTAVATTQVEGNGVAAEITPTEGEEVKHKLIFPCPPIKEETLWNQITVGLKLKAFGNAAEECISEVEVELTSAEKFGVRK